MQRDYKVSSHYVTNQSNFRSHFKYLTQQNKRPSMQRDYKVSSHYVTNQSNFRSHFKYLTQYDLFLRSQRSIVLTGETYVWGEAHERCLFSMDGGGGQTRKARRDIIWGHGKFSARHKAPWNCVWAEFKLTLDREMVTNMTVKNMTFQPDSSSSASVLSLKHRGKSSLLLFHF